MKITLRHGDISISEELPEVVTPQLLKALIPRMINIVKSSALIINDGNGVMAKPPEVPFAQLAQRTGQYHPPEETRLETIQIKSYAWNTFKSSDCLTIAGGRYGKFGVPCYEDTVQAMDAISRDWLRKVFKREQGVNCAGMIATVQHDAKGKMKIVEIACAYAPNEDRN